MHYSYGPMMDSGDWASGLFMMVFWIIVLAMIAFVALRYLKDHEPHTTSHVDPLDIAKERYAKGEITKEQFEQVKKDLK